MASGGFGQFGFGQRPSFTSGAAMNFGANFRPPPPNFSNRGMRPRGTFRGRGGGGPRPLMSQEAVAAQNPQNEGLFCEQCKVMLTPGQAQQHYSGKIHLTRVKEALKYEPQPLMPTGGSAKKRTLGDSEEGPEFKKFKMSLDEGSPLTSKSGIQLLNLYKHGVKLEIVAVEGPPHAPIFMAQTEVDNQVFTATGPSKKKAQQTLAEHVVSKLWPSMQEVLTKHAEEQVKREKKLLEEANSLEVATTSDSGVTSGTNDQNTSPKGVVSDRNRKHKSASHMLNLIRGKQTFTVESDLAAAEGTDAKRIVVVSVLVDGEKFEGQAHTQGLAKALASEAALVKLFDLKFDHLENGFPVYTGELSDLGHLLPEASPAQIHADMANNDPDDRNPVMVLNELFSGQVKYEFGQPKTYDWGIEHSVRLCVEGLSIEALDPCKKNAKTKAAHSALLALKASGMYARKIAEKEAKRTGKPVELVLQEGQNSNQVQSVIISPLTAPAQKGDSNAVAKLNKLFSNVGYVITHQFLGGTDSSFTISVVVNDQVFVGTARSKKLAKLSAAESALKKLGHWTAEDEKAKSINKSNQVFENELRREEKEGLRAALTRPAAVRGFMGSATGRGAAGRGAMGRGAAGRGVMARGAAGRGAAGRGFMARGAAGRGFMARGAAGRGAAGRGVMARGAAGRGVMGRGALGRGAVGGGFAGRGAAVRGAFGRGAARGVAGGAPAGRGFPARGGIAPGLGLGGRGAAFGRGMNNPRKPGMGGFRGAMRGAGGIGAGSFGATQAEFSEDNFNMGDGFQFFNASESTGFSAAPNNRGANARRGGAGSVRGAANAGNGSGLLPNKLLSMAHGGESSYANDGYYDAVDSSGYYGAGAESSFGGFSQAAEPAYEVKYEPNASENFTNEVSFEEVKSFGVPSGYGGTGVSFYEDQGYANQGYADQGYANQGYATAGNPNPAAQVEFYGNDAWKGW